MTTLILGIVMIISLAIGGLIGAIVLGKQYDKHCNIVSKTADRYSEIATMMTQWVGLYIDGKTIADFCHKHGHDHVTVYGLSEIGYLLIDELEKNNIEISYCIDRNADNIFSRMNVYRPDEELPKTDVVIVAIVQYYDEIKEMLMDKLDCPIVSLADVVWEV